MATNKIQIIVFLTAVISGGTCPLGAAAASADGGPNTLFAAANTPVIQSCMSAAEASLQPGTNGRATPPAFGGNTLAETPSILPGAEPPNLSTPTDSAGTRELFFKMMGSVVLVVVLGAVAIYASKRLAGKIANLPGKKIKIVETAHLGPKKAVHLIRIGDLYLLMGSTNDNITKLADVTTEILMQQTGLAEDIDRADTRKTGPLTEFGPALEPADGLANLSTKYAENPP
ncbi:MAG TPA: flagellar biosynthetic protein FliO [Sedimentisphaerales bacterium]|nr:flagellar biosynthetic protein FliO [Sedimentisphaerales bacterium]